MLSSAWHLPRPEFRAPRHAHLNPTYSTHPLPPRTSNPLSAPSHQERQGKHGKVQSPRAIMHPIHPLKDPTLNTHTSHSDRPAYFFLLTQLTVSLPSLPHITTHALVISKKISSCYLDISLSQKQSLKCLTSLTKQTSATNCWLRYAAASNDKPPSLSLPRLTRNPSCHVIPTSIIVRRYSHLHLASLRLSIGFMFASLGSYQVIVSLRFTPKARDLGP